MDMIDDTELAKQNFYQYEIEGPTKYNDLGEKYLRLNGVLNAGYMQKMAIVCISKYSNNGNLKKFEKLLKNTQILNIRHSIASHNLDCDEDNGINVFMSSQIDMHSTNVGTLDKDNTYKVTDIKPLMINFDQVVTKELIDSIDRLLKIIPNNVNDKKKLKRQLYHCKRCFNGELYTSIEGDNIYLIGLGSL